MTFTVPSFTYMDELVTDKAPIFPAHGRAAVLFQLLGEGCEPFFLSFLEAVQCSFYQHKMHDGNSAILRLMRIRADQSAVGCGQPAPTEVLSGLTLMPMELRFQVKRIQLHIITANIYHATGDRDGRLDHIAS